MLLIIKIKFLTKKFSTPWYKYSNVEVENLSLGRPVTEWGGCQSSTINDHLFRRQRKNIDQWEQLTLVTRLFHPQTTKSTYGPKQPSPNFEKLPWLPRIPYAHVIPRDVINNKLSYVACTTQHLLCCVQHSTFPVLNAINMFASCNPCIVT